MVKHSQYCDERFFGVAIHDVTRSLSLLDEAGFRLSGFCGFLELRVLQGFKLGGVGMSGLSYLWVVLLVHCLY